MKHVIKFSQALKSIQEDVYMKNHLLILDDPKISLMSYQSFAKIINAINTKNGTKYEEIRVVGKTDSNSSVEEVIKNTSKGVKYQDPQLGKQYIWFLKENESIPKEDAPAIPGKQVLDEIKEIPKNIQELVQAMKGIKADRDNINGVEWLNKNNPSPEALEKMLKYVQVKLNKKPTTVGAAA